MNKEEFRARGLQARNALDLEDQTENSFQIMKKLLKLDDFVLAETIAFFVGIKTEVLTEPMIQEALLGGKTVLVPVSDMKSRTMFFAQIESLEELEETEHGLYEPLNGTEFPLEEIDIIVVPMSAFDLQGNRLGYGKGFYDKMFWEIKKAKGKALFVGLGFECQLFEGIPNDKHDLKLDLIITEKRVVRC